ncbi:hypothetical protein GVAV_001597 [Gurleya vavrai]
MFFCHFSLVSLKLAAKLSELHSLFSPALDENGRSHRISFHNDYVVKTFAGDSTYAQLCYDGHNSSAGLISKNPITFDNFRIDINFELKSKEQPGMGLAFWLQKEENFTKGQAYGRNENFDGLLLAIDTQKNTPFIGLIVGKGTYTNQSFTNVINLRKEFYDAPATLRIEKYANELKIFLSVRDATFKEIYNIKNPGITQPFYYAISAQNNAGSNLARIFSIKTNELEFIYEEDKMEKKSGIMLWGIFFLVICGIGYILYQKQYVKKTNRA